MAALIVPQKYVAEGMRRTMERRAKANGWRPPDVAKEPEEPANRGSLQANLNALGECQTAEEQKALILAMLGDVSGIRPLGNRVLVITHIRPGGKKIVREDGTTVTLYNTDKKQDGNRFEGKTGLVIAVGPTAFRYDGAWPWEGEHPKVGDWIWYRASDAVERGFKNVWGRMITDDLIEGIVEDPMDVF